MAEAAIDAAEPDELERLATRPENLYHSFYLEVAWKNHSLRTGHFYLKALLENGEEALRICSQAMVDLVVRARAELGRKPRVLDVGCGPVSSLAYLVHEDLAEVLGVDPLAAEYAELLDRHGRRSPVTQVAAHGEWLDEAVEEGGFDIVHVKNALDHTQSPCLTWLNMFRALRVGGWMMQSHSIREATKEKWRQLHQFDLYPDETGDLWLQDAFGTNVCLTRTLPLKLVFKTENRLEDGHGWTSTIHRKMDGDWRDPSYLDICLRQMKTAFRKRSNAALEAERHLVKTLEARSPGRYPYKCEIVSRA